MAVVPTAVSNPDGQSIADYEAIRATPSVDGVDFLTTLELPSLKSNPEALACTWLIQLVRVRWRGGV